jgi:hypothetical protein
MEKIRWIDMIDPIYTLAKLAGIDPDVTKISGISVMDNYLVVWYFDEKNIPRHMSLSYETE